MLIFETWVERIKSHLVTEGVCGGEVEKNRELPTDDELLPLAIVVCSGDEMEPDGAANHGPPSYKHTTSLAVTAVDKASDGPALRAKLAAHGEAILTALLSKTAWRTEEIEAVGNVRHIFEMPPDGRSYVGRIEIQFDVIHRTTWEPVLPDGSVTDLSEIAFDSPPASPVIEVPTE